MKESQQYPDRNGMEIAVIGMAGRFPGAKNIDVFWDNLKNGVKSISFFSDEELLEAGIDPEHLNRPDYVKAKGALQDIETFDASFFEYPAREAELMDPQLRFLHESTWEVLEHAGYDPGSYPGLIGLYVGASQNYLWLAQFQNRVKRSGANEIFELGTLNNNASFCTRIAYKLDLKGPAVFVQTACSTSLVAIHLACQGLLAGECGMALAGGVSISIPKKSGYFYQEGMLNSISGHLRAFDAAADGTIFGNGIGMVALKLLDEAVADGNTIHAVVKGSAVNNDGGRRVGFTAPGTKGQAAVIRTALQAAGVEPETIGFIECHGTGTKLGDPIEVQASKEAFNTDKKGFCALGTLKTNVGHLDVAAGAAGFIKTVLALKYKLIPPSLNFDIPNPGIDFIDSPFYVNTSPREWKKERDHDWLRAGISSFGIGGTNAHVVLEEWPSSHPGGAPSTERGAWRQAGDSVSQPPISSEFHLILLSARTQPALETMTENLADYLKKNPDLHLADVAYTLQVGRKSFKHRRMTLCTSVDEAAAALSSPGCDSVRDFILADDHTAAVIDLPGQEGDVPGSRQWWERIGDLWLQGQSIDWNAFYREKQEKRKRLPLPAYPFERQRYWIETKEEEAAVPPWNPGACWLVFMDDPAVISPLLEQLQNAGASVLPVNSPTRFKEIFPGHRPRQTSQPGETIQDLSGRRRPGLSSEYAPPTNGIEEVLSEICREYFGLDQVGIYDDFLELGANSLGIITLATRIHKALDVLVQVPVFFNKPNIKGVAEYIKQAQTDIYRSIHPSEKKEYYGLSSVQTRLYVLQQIDNRGIGYNLPTIFTLEGLLNKNKLEDIFRLLIKRHESLRTSFHMIAGEPVQRVHEKVEFEIEYIDLEEVNVEIKGGDGEGTRGLAPLSKDPAARGSQPVSDIISSFVRPFDLSRAPLLRVGLIKLLHNPTALRGHPSQEGKENKYLLMVDLHHIIADGISMNVMISESMSLYSGQPLPVPRIQYKDFTGKQNSDKHKEMVTRQRDYWLKKFAGEIPVLNLPADYARPTVRSYEGSRINFELGVGETNALNRLAKEERVTMYSIVLAGFNVLLTKLDNQEDIVIGTTMAGRRQGELEQVVGMFVNTLALRNYPNREKTFARFLQEVKENTVSAFENQEYPFEELVDRLTGERDTGRNPIFDVMLQFNNYEMSELKIPGMMLKPYEYDNRTSKFDLTLWGWERGEKLVFAFQYSTKLFKRNTVEIFTRYFIEILSLVTAFPHKKLEEILQIPGERKQDILEQMNREIKEEMNRMNTGGQTFQQRLSDSLVRFEHKIALEYGPRFLSYRELDKRSNHVANRVLAKGIKKETFIGVLMDDRVQLIITSIGIMKAGCIFVPLDSSYPKERLENMIGSLGIHFIFVDKYNVDIDFKQPAGELESIFIQRWFTDGESSWSTRPTGIRHQPGDKLYVYFTSGSTGAPKAILGKNNSLLHFLDWEISTFAVDNTFKVSQLITPGFDAFLRDVFVPLFAGGTLCIPFELNIKLTARDLIDWVEQSRVNLIHCVPTLFRILKPDHLTPGNFKALKFVLFSGERINASDLSEWYDVFDERITFVNLYGPTETTLIKTYHVIESEDLEKARIPVGRPMRGTAVMIMDKEMNLCDRLVTGDIYIRTPYGTYGYLNEPVLNSEKFLPNPFGSGPGDVIYKTGDTGKIMADGNIDLLGRNDRQVKVRGIRIEPEGIENVLLGHPLVKEAVVIKKKLSDHDEVLWAYITGKGNPVPPGKTFTRLVKEFLAEKLPGYMLPANITDIEDIPKKPNGKVDYKALEALDIEKAEYIAPGSDVEKKLAEFWSHILKTDKIGLMDNFFRLGGNSFNVMNLVSLIHMAFGVKLPLSDIFNNPTLEKLAALIAGSRTGKYAGIKSAEEKEYYPLSSAQKRLYILYQMDAAGIGYNMPVVLELEGDLHKNKLEATSRELVQRHESFRTSFMILNEEPVQKIHEPGTFVFALDYHEAAEQEANDIIDNFSKPFDLSKPPLIKVVLIKVTGKRYFLAMDMHHIISDGVSFGILVRDFMSLYEGNKLPGLRLQYKDFSQWRENSRDKTGIKTREEYWLNRFKGEIPVISLPTDFTRPMLQDFEGDTIPFVINEEITAKIKKLSRQEDVSIFMVVLAILYILLEKVSGDEDIVIGTGIDGRNHEEYRQIIGMFVNTVVLRNFPSPLKSFQKFLGELRENVLESFENQGYPFEELVEKLRLKRDTGRNPLFDVMLQFNNFELQELKIPGLKITPRGYNKRISRFDLTLWGWERDEGISFAFEYSRKLFKRETITLLIKYFKEIARQVTTAPGKRLKEIKRISKESKQEMLLQFNRGIEQEAARMRRKAQTLQHRLSSSAGKFENEAAIEYGEYLLTYREVEICSNRIAARLMKKNMPGGTFIGILMNDRMSLILTMIGILKCNCVFVPLDTAHPRERLELMMESIGIKFILVDESNINAFAAGSTLQKPGVELVAIEKLLMNETSLPPIQMPALQYHPGDKIYIYFTSGSIGKPKAIVGKNESLLHFIDWEIDTFGIHKGSRVSQLINPGFDAFLRDVLVPLCSGGVVCIPASKDSVLNSYELMKWIDRSGIDLIHCVPGLFRTLDVHALPGNSLKSLRFILFSGERINPGDLVDWFRQFDGRIEFVNLYGPTETTLIKTCHFIRKDDLQRERIPVGKPMRGAEVMILDNEMNLCEKLVPGEIYIYTPYKTYGYYNDPTANKERFVQNPFNHVPDDTIYKTGDMGKLLEDGSIDLLGRNDRQVKIRGIRIELEEIESVLVKNPLVKEAVVIKKETSDHNELLCAYITGKNKNEISEASLIKETREYLLKRLPAYMVPSRIVKVEDIPKNPNGKVDYKALQIIDTNNSDYILPRNDIEEGLVKIWSDILKIDEISIRSNFFDLGGNSLNTMNLIARIFKKFDVKISLGDTFNNPTIEMQAKIIANTRRVQYKAIEQQEEKEYHEVSHAQKRVWALSQIKEASVAFNMPRAILLEGELNQEALVKAFTTLLERHETLRTIFIMMEHDVKQKILALSAMEFELKFIDLRECKEEERNSKAVELVIRESTEPFDLSVGPLLRICLIQRQDLEYVFVFNMHHIIGDFISVNILIREVFTLYTVHEKTGINPLRSLQIQYRDYAVWQNKCLQGGYLESHRQYWLDCFKDLPPVIDLPIDKQRPAVQTYRGGHVRFNITDPVAEALKTLGEQHQVTLFMTMLSALGILLYYYTGQDDIVIGTPIANREHADLEYQMGLYLNTLALRIHLHAEETFSRLLQKVKRISLDAFEHQLYPFDMLVEDLGIKREPGRTPLFDVMIDMLNFTSSQMPGINGNLKIAPFKTGWETSKFDLTFYIEEGKNTLGINLEYNTDIFEHETIKNIAQRFRVLLDEIVKNPDIIISDFDLEESRKTPTIGSTSREKYLRD